MTQMDSVTASLPVSPTMSTPDLSHHATDNRRSPRCAWFERLESYLASPKAADGAPTLPSSGRSSGAGIDWGEIFAILGGKNPRVGLVPYRFQRSAGNVDVVAPAAREPVVGAPLKPDFGLELISLFRKSELNTWQRADAIARVLQEWADKSPSGQAGKRLRKLFEPAYINTPDEPAGGIVVDAIMLHLMDRGRYAALVRDHIASLKRSGDYEPLVNALHHHYPGKDAAWAESTVDKLLGEWDVSLGNASGGDDGGSIPPGIDLDTRLKKFHQLMNPDYRPGQERPIIERRDTGNGSSAPPARPGGAVKYA